MKFTEIHAAIHKDFGAEVAMAAVQILAISMITKIAVGADYQAVEGRNVKIKEDEAC